MEFQRITVPVEGMTCAACVSRVEKVLTKLEGVKNVSVNLGTETASFDIDADIFSKETASEKLSKFGYEIKFIRDEKSSAGDQTIINQSDYDVSLKKDFITALIFTIPVFLLNMGMMFDFFYKIIPLTPDQVNKVLLILTTPVVFIPGKRFFSVFWKNIRHFSADMNTLVAIGTGSAFAYSALLTLFPEIFPHGGHGAHVYYDTSAVIITLILMGKFLEYRARKKTSDEIKKLIELTPATAEVRRNGSVITVKAEDLRSGDTVIVKPGGKIPADGTVTEGFTTVDESMLTGESIPVEKIPGKDVTGGTLNLNGTIEFTVKATGDNSTLGRIIKYVREAQSSKAPIQDLADKVAAVFVPVVIGIAVFSFAGWMIAGGENSFSNALNNFIAVLIIACPCSLGLATPAALITGIGLGASKGILIKNGKVLEEAKKLDYLVLDKTGTVTLGKPEVRKIEILNGEEQTVLNSLFALENLSNHPLSKAVTGYLDGKTTEIPRCTDFTYIPAGGIKGVINGTEVKAGTGKFLEDHGVDTQSLITDEDGYGARVYFAEGNTLKAIVYIEDSVVEGAHDAIKEIKKMGIKPVMLSGDSHENVRRVAAETGIEEYHSGLLPQEKADYIAALQLKGYKVGMIGDGVNDAPALARSDVSFAVGHGSEAAIETAEITVLSGHISDVPRAIRLSGITLTTIKQNLFWAFFYNIIGIPLAAAGLLDPMIAALAMSLSSVSVVSNSLRIRLKKL